MANVDEPTSEGQRGWLNKLFSNDMTVSKVTPRRDSMSNNHISENKMQIICGMATCSWEPHFHCTMFALFQVQVQAFSFPCTLSFENSKCIYVDMVFSLPFDGQAMYNIK